MFTTTKSAVLASLAIFAMVLGMLYSAVALPVEAALPNMFARVSTSTVAIAGPQQVRTLFPARGACSSRNITTSSSSIMISFAGDILTPSASAGHWQAGSTTVAYDAELWGCGPVTVFGFASTSVTITETAFN